MEVVDFLNDLWTVFDDIINKFNVYKVRARVSFPALCGLQLAVLATFCPGFALFFYFTTLLSLKVLTACLLRY